MVIKKQKKIIFSSLAFSIMAIIAYIILFNRNNKLFWMTFVCERLYTLGAKEELNDSLENLDLENDENPSKTIGLITMVTLFIVMMFIYMLIRFPRILIIVILGEIIDIILYKIYNNLNRNNKNI